MSTLFLSELLISLTVAVAEAKAEEETEEAAAAVRQVGLLTLII